MEYDFSGWATRNDLLCQDGRTIRKNAFKDNDGKIVPLVWNHQHDDAQNVLGHALLENREDGVYAYGTFNDTDAGKSAKELVKHGDISSLSIYANKLKQNKGDVIHGQIRELSLVLAGANPGAYIDFVMAHSEDGDAEEISELQASYNENIVLYHSDEPKKEEQKKEEPKKEEPKKMAEKTVGDVFNELTEEQKTVVYAMIGQALEDAGAGDEGDDDMKHNIFDNDEMTQDYLTHSDQEAIIALAKQPNVGNFKQALEIYMDENFDGGELAHSMDSLDELFPEYHLQTPGAPDMITRDLTWVDSVLNKVHKSPYSRIKTRRADLRKDDIRAMGYEKTKEKKLIGNWSLLNRKTDPQTVYVKDKLDRDDIVDITDFDIVEYQRKIMRMALNEELAKAIMIGDGRQEGDEGKIHENYIRPIWQDEELYTIHADVDIKAAKAELQGSNTSANFGDNYIYAEAIITASLYSREKYKGSGSLDFYCTPHLLNVMLLARDLNGRRLYSSKSDLAAALNVNAIHTVEQFENKTRTTSVEEGSKKKKLMGLFVNLSDYQLGCVKGGEITNFEDFNIDFNQYKYLMETRLSGANVVPFSAIALEEDVTENVG